MNRYLVIGVLGNSRQRFRHAVEAADPLKAQIKARMATPEPLLIAAVTAPDVVIHDRELGTNDDIEDPADYSDLARSKQLRVVDVQRVDVMLVSKKGCLETVRGWRHGSGKVMLDREIYAVGKGDDLNCLVRVMSSKGVARLELSAEDWSLLHQDAMEMCLREFMRMVLDGRDAIEAMTALKALYGRR